jgi:hypothetical protein
MYVKMQDSAKLEIERFQDVFKSVIELKIVDLYSFKKATKTCKLDK